MCFDVHVRWNKSFCAVVHCESIDGMLIGATVLSSGYSSAGVCCGAVPFVAFAKSVGEFCGAPVARIHPLSKRWRLPVPCEAPHVAVTIVSPPRGFDAKCAPENAPIAVSATLKAQSDVTSTCVCPFVSAYAL